MGEDDGSDDGSDEGSGDSDEDGSERFGNGRARGDGTSSESTRRPLQQTVAAVTFTQKQKSQAFAIYSKNKKAAFIARNPSISDDMEIRKGLRRQWKRLSPGELARWVNKRERFDVEQEQEQEQHDKLRATATAIAMDPVIRQILQRGELES